jgi:hypothetical protein
VIVPVRRIIRIKTTAILKIFKIMLILPRLWFETAPGAVVSEKNNVIVIIDAIQSKTENG